MALLYGLSGILGPPSIAPGATDEEIAENRRQAEERARQLAIAGRKHWLRAHRTLHWTQEGFKSWHDDIPNFGCACKPDADAYIAAHPPPLESDELMFIWFVDFHDATNIKIGKPVFGVPAARVLYCR